MNSPSDTPALEVDPQLAAARLFRSIRAGRAWVRSGAPVETPRHSACVPMKPGNGAPPVFMFPGAPGSILQLAPIATGLPGTVPVYAIKPRGLEQGETPCRTIAEMAEYSLDAIRTVQPAGPYRFIGYSAGGLVAIEAAQRLAAAGENVPLIVLLDTYPSRQAWPLACHAEILGRRAVEALWALRRYRAAELVGELGRRLRSLAGYLAESGIKALPLPPVDPEGFGAASRELYVATYNAGEAYRPPRYAGKIVFVQPTEIPPLKPRSAKRVWRRFLPDFEVCVVHGSHLEIVEAGAGAAAAAIGEYLSRAT